MFEIIEIPIAHSFPVSLNSHRRWAAAVGTVTAGISLQRRCDSTFALQAFCAVTGDHRLESGPTTRKVARGAAASSRRRLEFYAARIAGVA